MIGQLLFRQLFDTESSTYTYLLADKESKEAVLIDPVLERAARDKKLVEELGLSLKYTLETHVHADHVTGADSLRKALGSKAAVGASTGVKQADVYLGDGDKLLFGSLALRALATPGHTSGCTCYHLPGMVFTGDTLFIRGNGRTDFQEGSPGVLYESIHSKLFTLADDTLVYPGHDYNGQTASTIGEEKRFNSRVRLGVTKEQFVATMNGLKLANPKKIDEAVPANLVCGRALSAGA
jgi:sulfur dioxygenase